MSNARFISAIALTSLVTASIVAGLTLSRSAHAEVPASAVCAYSFGGSSRDLAKVGPATSEWMNAQIAAGRSRFIPVGGTVVAPGICAW